jgi:hypothetical protein
MHDEAVTFESLSHHAMFVMTQRMIRSKGQHDDLHDDDDQ